MSVVCAHECGTEESMATPQASLSLSLYVNLSLKPINFVNYDSSIDIRHIMCVDS